MKITKSYLKRIVLEEVQKMQEMGKSGRPYFEDPEGQKKWKKERKPIEKKHFMGWDDEDDEDPDELDMLGMQFGADEDQMAWAREMEEGRENNPLAREKGGGGASTHNNLAIIDYDEGGITISDNWRPPTRLDFLSFEEIEGGKENPKTGDEIEKIILDFFKENGVSKVRDVQMDVSNIEPQEWLDTMIMNHPAGSDRRPPEGHAGGHSVRNRREKGMSPFDHDPWTADGWKS